MILYMNIIEMINIRKPAPSKAYFSFILVAIKARAVRIDPINPNIKTVIPMNVS